MKLAALQASCEAITNDGAEDTLQRSVEQLRGQLAQTALMYEERNRVATNQENQINALNNQVASLKEVVSITRDLLQIRNMEVKHLQVSRDDLIFNLYIPLTIFMYNNICICVRERYSIYIKSKRTIQKQDKVLLRKKISFLVSSLIRADEA